MAKRNHDLSFVDQTEHSKTYLHLIHLRVYQLESALY